MVDSQSRRALGELLVAKGLINEEQLQEALEKQKKAKRLLGQVLIDLDFVKEADVVMTLREQTGMPSINLDQLEIPRDILDRVSPSVTRIYKVIPVSWEDNTLILLSWLWRTL